MSVGRNLTPYTCTSRVFFSKFNFTTTARVASALDGVPLVNNPATMGDFRVARVAFCATAPGDAVLHWQFWPPDPLIRNSDIVDENSMSVANRTFYTDYVVHVDVASATHTSTPTYTLTPTPSGMIARNRSPS